MTRKNLIILAASMLIAVLLVLEMMTQFLSIKALLLILLPIAVLIIVLALMNEPSNDGELMRMVKTQQFMFKKMRRRRNQLSKEEAILKSRQ